jgi:AcrR family transcriptional regulator
MSNANVAYIRQSVNLRSAEFTCPRLPGRKHWAFKAVMDKTALEQDPPAAAPVRTRDTALRRERTRRRVLDAAFALMGHERGLAVRIEEICAEAGISRGTFYNYFSGLEALFDALSFDLSHAFNTAVLATMARMDSMAARTNAAMRYYLERARSNPNWGWAMVNISATGPLFGAETFASALATVEDGIALGEFAIEDARLGRDIILGTALAAMITQLREGTDADQPMRVARHVLRALGVPDDRVEAVIARPLPEPTLA